MKFLFSAVVMALAALGAAGDDEGLIGRESIQCESSEASPYLHHITQLIDNLREEDDSTKCFSDMLGKKSHSCGNTINDYTGKDGGAVFSLCSGDMDMWDDVTDRDSHCKSMKPGKIECTWCEGWMEPTEIADKLEAIMDECKNPSRAGGIHHLRHGGQLRLYTAPAHF